MPLSRHPFPNIGPQAPPRDFEWFHIVLTTYGTWLPGDSRGFRTRHHRQHVEGDYKSPPKEDYTGLNIASAAQMNYASTRVPVDCCRVLGLALIERLQQLGGFVLTAAVSGSHVHLMVKLPGPNARTWIGLAKKHAWFEMRDAGWQSKLWAKRGKIEPVRGATHHRNCFRYIVNHLHQGAWVWVREGIVDEVVDRVLKK